MLHSFASPQESLHIKEKALFIPDLLVAINVFVYIIPQTDEPVNIGGQTRQSSVSPVFTPILGLPGRWGANLRYNQLKR